MKGSNTKSFNVIGKVLLKKVRFLVLFQPVFWRQFDCLNHEILIAKLNAYDLTSPALKFIRNYSSNEKQRVPVNDSYSLWQDILFGVPQDTILGCFLFNILLGDLLFTLNHTEIANYADGFAPYALSDDIDDLIASLEKCLKDLLKWFNCNLRKSNPDNCHLLVSSREKI